MGELGITIEYSTLLGFLNLDLYFDFIVYICLCSSVLLWYKTGPRRRWQYTQRHFAYRQYDSDCFHTAGDGDESKLRHARIDFILFS